MSEFIASFLFLGFLLWILCYGLYRNIDVLKSFREGGKTGLDTMLNIAPLVVGMVTSVQMLRASGFLDALSHAIAPALTSIGLPSELLPLMFMRPFSGSASNALLVDLLKKHGGNSLIGMMGATIMGSTETTFFLITVYFSSVGVKKIRYALWTSLIADLCGMLAAAYWVARILG